MIENISFKNYKCLSGKSFDLKPLNIFTGYNGRGKSSVMQALLMLGQSVSKDDSNSLLQFHVNGKFVKLGDFDELLSDTNNFALEFDMRMQDAEKQSHSVNLGYEMSDDYKVGKLTKLVVDKDDYYSSQSSFSEKQEKGEEKKILRQLPHYINEVFDSNNIHYVSANRMGPVSFVERKEIPESHSVGANGDMTINTLHTYQLKIEPIMNEDITDTASHTLIDSVAIWMDYIMNGEKGSVTVDDGSDTSKTETRSSVLRLDFIQNDRSYHAYNVGFGYSYILSIVVTALIAKAGNIVIVENPEAHLHPEAQFRLTELLVKLATRGVQVFIETHSEHVVNAVRLAVIRKQFAITNDQIGLFFFDYDYSKRDLSIEKNGRIEDWPSRFFDQYQLELAQIIREGAQVQE
ncbi:MAG: DUF3696 domain-containing protein [Paludibacteraceae bacterium]|jgi:predicted ATPase|nr:DUF3696 domain-containing protein [Paludibacteraceae bacterium]